MKSFLPKADDTPPVDDAGSPPRPDTTAEDQTETTEVEKAPMPRPTRKNRNAEVDFRGEMRSNATHASTTELACCRFRGHEDKIVTKELESGYDETEVQP